MEFSLRRLQIQKMMHQTILRDILDYNARLGSKIVNFNTQAGQQIPVLLISDLQKRNNLFHNIEALKIGQLSHLTQSKYQIQGYIFDKIGRIAHNIQDISTICLIQTMRKANMLSDSERRKQYDNGKKFLADYALCISTYNRNKNIKEAVSVLKKIVPEIKNEGLGVLLAFDSYSQFQKLIENCYKQHQTGKDISQDFVDKMITLYALAYAPYFQYQSNYRKYLDYFKSKLKISKEVTANSYLGADTERYKQHVQLLTEYFELKKEEASFGKGKRLNGFVNNYLSTLQSSKKEKGTDKEKNMIISRQVDIYEECLVTFLRKGLEIIQEDIWYDQKIQKLGMLCCQLHFQAGKKVELVESLHQSFYTLQYFPSNDPQRKMVFIQTCKDYVLKTIISFLNTQGGCLYLGFQGENKNGLVRGIPLSENDKLNFLEYFIKEIVIGKIYPPDEQKLEESKEDEDRRLDKDIKALTYNYQQKLKQKIIIDSAIISKYVSIQFLNVYEKDTLFYSRPQVAVKDEDKLNYIVKIMVKAGDPYEVYHMVNDKEVPEAFVREDKTSKKKTMYEFYDMVYDRLKKKANNNTIKQLVETHSLCRVCLKAEQSKTKTS